MRPNDNVSIRGGGASLRRRKTLPGLPQPRVGIGRAGGQLHLSTLPQMRTPGECQRRSPRVDCPRLERQHCVAAAEMMYSCLFGAFRFGPLPGTALNLAGFFVSSATCES